MSDYKNVKLLDHPLLQHKITFLRDKQTGAKEFRELINEVSTLMIYEATRDLPLKEVTVETPLDIAVTKVIAGRKLAFVPILRAGLGMVDGAVALVPAAKVGHIGVCRRVDKTGVDVYYCKMPFDIHERDVIVMDLMLASGCCSSAALSRIKEKGARSLKFVCVLACQTGIDKLQKDHPDVEILCGGIDKELNEDLYIVPGFGDGGDRIFGTK
ncbi:uracil phosphoribosyltransferase [Clostridia bacterium]|nr:uracil phosphoribosyltransferase [Clostridia bacterium]